MENTPQSPSDKGSALPWQPPKAEEQARLLSIAREAIRARLEGKDYDSTSRPRPDEVCIGAFVTLTEGGRLRGCIGRMESGEPLSKTIAEMAREAAFDDPRFSPVSKGEFEKLRIEISLLGPRRPVSSASEIEVGKHGVWLKLGYAQAVFLPQVATEQGWDRETLLRELCRKAGLDSDAWMDRDAVLMVFEGFVFGELPRS